jgi:mono/diheme cytochrome c family protein
MIRLGVSLFGVALAAAWCQGTPLDRAPRIAANSRRNADERDLGAGAKLYARECAACHGANREGRGKVPPLNGEEVRQAPPGALFWVLRNGSIRKGMPSFAHLPDSQRWQIVTWLKYGNGATRSDASTAAKPK